MPMWPIKGMIHVIKGSGDHSIEKEKSVFCSVLLSLELLLDGGMVDDM